MAKKSKVARLVAELDGWGDRELKELVAIVQALIESRKTEEPMEDADEDGSSTEKSKGHVEPKTANDYSPYRCLGYWQGSNFNRQHGVILPMQK